MGKGVKGTKKKEEDIESPTPAKSIRELSGCTHVVDDVNDNVEVVGLTLSEELSEWASTFRVTHNAVDALLKILQRQGHKELPSTARTLFDTTRKFKVRRNALQLR